LASIDIQQPDDAIDRGPIQRRLLTTPHTPIVRAGRRRRKMTRVD
jgi:hypothetical protein